MRIVGKVLMGLCLMGFVFVRADVVGAISYSGSFSGPIVIPDYPVVEHYLELTLDGYDASLYQIDDFTLSGTFTNNSQYDVYGLNIWAGDGVWLGTMSPIDPGVHTLTLRPREDEWREDQLEGLNEALSEEGTVSFTFDAWWQDFTLNELSLTIEASERPPDPPDPVPEPATIVLLAGGVLGLTGLRSKGRWNRA